ncbi:hypothetical protein D3C87_1670860 [compost metagenome]
MVGAVIVDSVTNRLQVVTQHRFARAVVAFEERRRHQRHQRTDDGHDRHQFNQRKAGAAALTNLCTERH